MTKKTPKNPFKPVPRELAQRAVRAYYGDPDAVMPGERPEAYDPKLTDERFARRFVGTEDDIRCMKNHKDEVVWGIPLPGEKIAAGHEVGPDGRVRETGEA